MEAPNASAHDHIEHVVVLALENHSFDQMLGCMKEVYPGLEGIDPQNPRSNADDKGKLFQQLPTVERQMLLDPHHEVEHVATQLQHGNSGFVLDFAKCYPDKGDEARGFIMGYYPRGFLPALHALAHEFTICDHWFASLPGPTWPNRFFALSGTSLGRVNMPDDGTHKADLPGYFQQDQDTIFDRLTEKGINWKVYFHDIPQSWVLAQQRKPHNAARYFYIREFFADARGSAKEFPSFCFIEPDFMGINENDDHPPHDIMKAEKLIADVFNSLRANEALWRSTLLVVFYDEHGGFYDHVTPPAAVPPDDHREEYAFDQLGVRVPALLVSPWVEKTFVDTPFDHTSLLRYVTEKWQLRPLPSRRVAAATSIGFRHIEIAAAQRYHNPHRIDRRSIAATGPRKRRRDVRYRQRASLGLAAAQRPPEGRALGGNLCGIAAVVCVRVARLGVVQNSIGLLRRMGHGGMPMGAAAFVCSGRIRRLIRRAGQAVGEACGGKKQRRKFFDASKAAGDQRAGEANSRRRNAV